jgi:hypothetical protein
LRRKLGQLPADEGGEMIKTLEDKFRDEMGENATYRKEGADYHKLVYVRWLEKQLAESVPWRVFAQWCLMRKVETKLHQAFKFLCCDTSDRRPCRDKENCPRCKEAK